jgi:hypothetical protein
LFCTVGGICGLGSGATGLGCIVPAVGGGLMGLGPGPGPGPDPGPGCAVPGGGFTVRGAPTGPGVDPVPGPPVYTGLGGPPAFIPGVTWVGTPGRTGWIFAPGGGATTARPANGITVGGAFTGTITGLAPGCATTALPEALITVGRLTFTGTGCAGAPTMIGRAGGAATAEAASGWNRRASTGVTAIAVCDTGRPEAMSPCFTTVTWFWLIYVTLVTFTFVTRFT